MSYKRKSQWFGESYLVNPILPNQPQKKLSTMSLQTLSLNCLACHILAKHPQLTKNNNLTATKGKYRIIKVSQSTSLLNNKSNHTTKPTIKKQLRKIA